MTCIVGMVDGGDVFIGADSCGSDGWTSDNVEESKVFKNNDFIIGYTGSFRLGQILEHGFKIPEKDIDQSYESYLVKNFLPAMIKTFKKHSFLRKEEEVAYFVGPFLLGYCGRLFEIQGDLSYLESSKGYASIGSGRMIAKGAIDACLQIGEKLSADEIITIAIKAAKNHVPTVAGEINILSI